MKSKINSASLEQGWREKWAGIDATLYFLLILALVRGVIYASVVPPWQAPDEPAHFERVRAALVAEEWAGSERDPGWYNDLRDSLYTFGFSNYIIGKLGNGPDQPLRDYIDLYHEIYGDLYSSRLAYAALGPPLWLAPTADVTLQLYLARLHTILIGVAIILLSYMIVRVIFPEQPFLYWGVPLLILFIPQHTYMLSTVNNGNLAELLVTLFFFLVAQALVRGFSWYTITAVLIVALTAMWVKATAYFLLASIATLGLFFLWPYRRHWYWLIPGVTILGGAFYYLAPVRLRLLAGQAISALFAGNFELPDYLLLSIFQSFWAVPGWAALQLEAGWYQLIMGACLLAILGLMIYLIRQRELIYSAQCRSQHQLLLLFAISIIAALGIQVGWQILTFSTSYSQGRTLYPLIVPIATLLILGWQQLIPSAWQKFGFIALAMSWILFDTLVLMNYIIPFFYIRS